MHFIEHLMGELNRRWFFFKWRGEMVDMEERMIERYFYGRKGNIWR